MSKNSSLLQHGFSNVILTGLLGLGLSYLLAVALVMIPIVQTYITYAHRVDFFGYNKFDHPEDYGLAPGKTVNMKLQSSDNTTIGAWFIVADSIHRERALVPPTPNQQLASIPSSLSKRPTILFLHGNTGTRALPVRVTVYTGLTARLDANLFTIDYRGFGDSAGRPTVDGVARDARTAWNYLISQGANPRDVLVVGHSLGAAIAGLLAADLARDGIEPRGLVLMSAFSSVRKLIDHYCLFGFLPLLKPLSIVPFAPRVVTWSLKHRFDTLALVPILKASVLLVHGENDWDIPHTHSSTLFEAFLEPFLPTPALTPSGNPSSGKHVSQSDFSAKQRSAIVTSASINGFGTLEEFVDHRKGGRRVAMLKTMAGGHDVGRLEGVQDAIGRMFDFN
ncbi:Monoacylglycerol lipase ABHD12 [Leucoagaricus sp. SymC.cos]|nr:Monoacylglycerol lipase ABHD12 [Leucoagaricus sp. SymC.cos]